MISASLPCEEAGSFPDSQDHNHEIVNRARLQAIYSQGTKLT